MQGRNKVPTTRGAKYLFRFSTSEAYISLLYPSVKTGGAIVPPVPMALNTIKVSELALLHNFCKEPQLMHGVRYEFHIGLNSCNIYSTLFATINLHFLRILALMNMMLTSNS